MANIYTAQNKLSIFYRLVLDYGEEFAFWVSPLDYDVASITLGGFTQDHTMIGFVEPVSRPAILNQNLPPDRDWLQTQMELDDRTLDLLMAMLPDLLLVPEADRILALAERWLELNPLT